MNSELKVALLVGGASAEREVSKLSGKGVRDALRSLGYDYKVIDPAYGNNQPDSEEIFFGEKNFVKPSAKKYIECIDSNLFDEIDTVFNGLHGRYGEDGMIQSLFELRGLTYTGSGVLASSISMNKSFTKAMFKHYGVNTPRWIIVRENYILKEVNELIKDTFGYPCAVKPIDEGSALGLSICNQFEDLDISIKTAMKYSEEIIIEEYIEGFEITVGILNNKSLPVLEIKPKHSYYDYTCKYTSGMSEYEVPAKFPQPVIEHISNEALLAYNSVGCTSYGRIDFRLSNQHEPYCLEVNTLPGLTSTSLLPKAAKAEGISFTELIDTIIKNSLK